MVQPATDNHKTKKPLFKRWWFILLMVLLGLAILGALFGDDETYSSSSSSTSSSAPSKAAAPQIFADLTCSDLAAEVGKNEMAFVRKYKGKTIKISGKVASINSTFGTAQVNLSTGDEWDINSCSAYPKRKGEWVYDLQNGQYINLICEDVSEVIGSPQLKDCYPAP